MKKIWMSWEAQFWLDNHYNTTIIRDRYGGIYSGAKWLAFPFEEAPEGPLRCDGWHEGSVEEFWDKFDGEVGRGATPEEALADLEKVMRALL